MNSIAEKGQTNEIKIKYSFNKQITAEMEKNEAALKVRGWQLSEVNWNEDELRQLVRTTAYTNSKLNDGYKVAANVEEVYFIVLDIDNNIEKDAFIEDAKKWQFSWFLHTTRSHKLKSKDASGNEVIGPDKFRVLIPLAKSITGEELRNKIKAHFLAKYSFIDASCFQGERFYHIAPEAETYLHNHQNGSEVICLDPDSIPETLLPKEKIKKSSEDFSSELKVRLADGTSTIIVKEIDGHTPIFCPFCNHANRQHPDSANAFIDITDSGKYYIACSSEDKTYWQNSEELLKDKCKDFYSYKTSVYEACLSKHKLTLNDIGKEKFFIRTYTIKNDRDELFNHLVLDHHITSLETNYISGPEETESSYRLNKDIESFEVLVPPIKCDLRDNEFIEDYLEEKFGVYKTFIKEWLAVYCFSNYKKLPDLILIGERGCGKNTFADMVGKVYEPLSNYAKDLTARFNQFAESKLVIIDESDDKGKPQYTLLKRLKGQERLQVEKKYMNEYSVRNNLNIIILSNSNIPIYVDGDEKPTDTMNNQFFVYKLPKSQKLINPEFGKELQRRFGHYMMDILKPIYETLDFSNKRYSIEVPITQDEANLFHMSRTVTDAETERIVRILADRAQDRTFRFYEFTKKGVIPSDYFDEQFNERENRFKIIRELQKREYLRPDKADKVMASRQRLFCYKLGQRWLDEIKKNNFETEPSAQMTVVKEREPELFPRLDY